LTLQDALYNWLQIHLVAEARANDRAAADTRDFFVQVLQEDHRIGDIKISVEKGMYHLDYEHEGTAKRKSFPKAMAEQLLIDIDSNPKYND
jgi:hypothetical protein